tara:strand:- start:31 stop:1347 length:1317 start_codon:yes stop_codon:yes gene_type:complete
MYWENDMEEIENTAQVLEMEVSALNEKIENIMQKNDFNRETDGQKIRACFRNWASGLRRMKQKNNVVVSNSSSGSFIKRGFGMFVGMDDIRNNMQYPRDMIKAACEHDLESVYRGGLEINSRPYGISLTTKTENGYQNSYLANGEEVLRDTTIAGKPLDENWFNRIKDASWEFELGWATPIDLTERFQNGDKNPSYCKPLPLTDNTRKAHFIGQGPSDESPKYWPVQVRDKGDGLVATNFADKVPLFEPLYFTGVWNDERNVVYGTYKSLDTLSINSELPDDHDDKIALTPKALELIQQCMSGYSTNLVNLDAHHNNAQTKAYSDRIVVTDGMVTNMQPSPNKVGNRTIWLASLDNYNYDANQYEDTVCWLPPHLDLDFGVGSQVLIIGRTSQRETTDEDTGETTLNPVTVNVYGLLVLERKGEPTVVSVESTDDDWW